MLAVHPEHWDKSKGGGTGWPGPPSSSGAAGKHRRGNWSAGQQRAGAELGGIPSPMHVPSGNGVHVLGPSLVRMGAVGAMQEEGVVPSLDSASAAVPASGVSSIGTRAPPLEEPDESSASSPVRLHADASEGATRRSESHTKRIPLARCNAWTQADSADLRAHDEAMRRGSRPRDGRTGALCERSECPPRASRALTRQETGLSPNLVWAFGSMRASRGPR